MNKLYLFITLLCMIELLLALLYLLLYGDELYDFNKMRHSKNCKKRVRTEDITQSDWDLLNRFLADFTETDLLRLNKIFNILKEKIDNF